MTLTAAVARDLLAALPGRVGPPLGEGELAYAERSYGFRFNPDHRTLLAAGLPLGERWPDWRDGDPGGLRDALDAPIDGVLFDVQENGFWLDSWGDRPRRLTLALSVARRRLGEAPRLIPVYGHRYAPGLPESGLPVFSVMQTDVIVYGADLATYLRREFDLPTAVDSPAPVESPAKPVPFWSDLL
ncbi:hypothetical protein [Catellatospora tritici]|uniref:hypothetical protein n=1 Tax=Catellatospora tritici TaxID=2851566 RepID=UPI001C2DBF4B|nr:hypothetical protein [Catellatospora tritici]MBV1848749.1 hypothetical protein [Catellatospora tritici]